MSLPRLKTAVLVKDLIKAIERQRDIEVKEAQSAEAKFEKEMVAYQDAFEKHIRARGKALQAHIGAKIAQVKPGFEMKPIRKYGYDDTDSWLLAGSKEETAWPSKPLKPSGAKCAATKYDSLLAQLKLSADEKIRLTPEDFAKFMAGDKASCAC